VLGLDAMCERDARLQTEANAQCRPVVFEVVLEHRRQRMVIQSSRAQPEERFAAPEDRVRLGKVAAAMREPPTKQIVEI
jgi:hypothetical protein